MVQTLTWHHQIFLHFIIFQNVNSLTNRPRGCFLSVGFDFHVLNSCLFSGMEEDDAKTASWNKKRCVTGCHYLCICILRVGSMTIRRGRSWLERRQNIQCFRSGFLHQSFSSLTLTPLGLVFFLSRNKWSQAEKGGALSPAPTPGHGRPFLAEVVHAAPNSSPQCSASLSSSCLCDAPNYCYVWG